MAVSVSFSIIIHVPSGKRLHNYGKSPFLIFNGKIHENPLFLWPFSIAALNYQRVHHLPYVSARDPQRPNQIHEGAMIHDIS